MIDGEEADDKIIAVMQGDGMFGGWDDINDVPSIAIEKIKTLFPHL